MSLYRCDANSKENGMRSLEKIIDAHFEGVVKNKDGIQIYSDILASAIRAELNKIIEKKKRKCKQCKIPYSDCGCYEYNRALSDVQKEIR